MNEDCDSTGKIEAPDEAADPEPDPDGRLSIDIVVQSGDWPDLPDLEPLTAAVARAIADELALSGGHHEAALALSSDAAVRSLNRTFRDLDKPTNVLSFPALPAPERPAGISPPDTDAARFLGDIALAEGTLQREADERGLPLQHHFAHLVTHGILHLFGFDHQAANEAEEMEALEGRVLRRLGIPDPYTTDEHQEEALGSTG